VRTAAILTLIGGNSRTGQSLLQRSRSGSSGHLNGDTSHAIAGVSSAIHSEAAADTFLRFGYEATARIRGIAPVRLAALLQDIHANFARHRTSAEIARAHGLSTGMLRAFRVGTGRTLHEYLTAVRVIHGARALALTDEKVSAIADSVGYRSKKDFYHVLHVHCGILPKALRALPSIERIHFAANIAEQLLGRHHRSHHGTS